MSPWKVKLLEFIKWVLLSADEKREEECDEGIRKLENELAKIVTIWGTPKAGKADKRRELIAEKEMLLYGKVVCFCCGEPKGEGKWTVEHIKPQAEGRDHSLRNLALSHRECNVRRGSSGKGRGRAERTLSLWQDKPGSVSKILPNVTGKEAV